MPEFFTASSNAAPSASCRHHRRFAIGGFVEIAPLFTIDETVEEAPDMRVYTPLELAGRNIYMREGCYACHSQMIRTLARRGGALRTDSLAVESKYDHPMLWGSKRTGPDLARVGGKYSDAWHVAHLINPRDVVPESVMPKYGWLRATIEDRGSRPASRRAARSACPIPTPCRQCQRRCLWPGEPDSAYAGGVRSATARRPMSAPSTASRAG
jgi:cytochrome c oxidase cbb3-type subunit 2